MRNEHVLRSNVENYVVRFDGEPTAQKGSEGRGVSKKRMNKTINSAIANLVKGTALADVIKAAVGPMLEDLKPKTKSDETKKDDEPLADIKGLSPEANALLKRQKTQIDELTAALRGMTDENKTEKGARQKAEVDGAIESVLNEYTFTAPTARETAKRLISMDVTRTDDGKIVAGDLPLADYVKDQLTKTHDYLLATAETGGAGAHKGVTRNTAGVGIETIKKDMTDSERQAVAGEISRAISAAQMM